MNIVRARHYITEEICDIHIDGDFIAAMDSPVSSREVLGSGDYWAAPGLIDIQVNGFMGKDFCSGDITVEEVTAVANDLLSTGVTGFCPTVTTNSNEKIKASLQAIAEACDKNELTSDRILAIHLEGPYISPEDGPRGAHPLEFVHNPDWEEFTGFQNAAGGRIGIITLDPGLPNALDFIRQAKESGIVVAIGHLSADREQIDAAVAAGAVLSTHLGNGAHTQLPRHPNYIWDQLANDALKASIIADGHHLPPEVLKSFYSVKGPEKLILISDLVAAAGLTPGKYQIAGTDFEVFQDGSSRILGSTLLAGSTIDFSNAIHIMMRDAGVPFANAIKMASENPARLLGLEEIRGCLNVGARADLVLFDFVDGKYELVMTIAGGQVCYER